MTEFDHEWAAPATTGPVIRPAFADADLVIVAGRVVKDRYGIGGQVLDIIAEEETNHG